MLDSHSLCMHGCRFHSWELEQGSVSVSSTGTSTGAPASAAATAPPSSASTSGSTTGQLSVLDLPKTSTEGKAFASSYRFFRKATQAFAEGQFPGQAAKQEELCSQSLLRMESSLVSQILTHWALSSGVSAKNLSERMTSLRKMFYFTGRMFNCGGADIVLSDLSISFKPDNPIAVSLYQVHCYICSAHACMCGLYVIYIQVKRIARSLLLTWGACHALGCMHGCRR